MFTCFPLFCSLAVRKTRGKIAESIARGSFRSDFSPLGVPSNLCGRARLVTLPRRHPRPATECFPGFSAFFASSSAFLAPSLGQVGSGMSSKIAEILKMRGIASVEFFQSVSSRSSPIFSWFGTVLFRARKNKSLSLVRRRLPKSSTVGLPGLPCSLGLPSGLP